MKSSIPLQENVPIPGPKARQGKAESIFALPLENPSGQASASAEDLAKVYGLLQATLESTKDGILALDLEGNVTSFNSSYAALWGLPPELLHSRDYSELLAFKARQAKDPDKLFAQARLTQSCPENESFDTVELKDGRILERRVVPQRVDNRCVGVVVNWHDATKRRRAEQELRDSQALYHSLVDQMPNGVFRKNAQGRFVFANAAYCRIMGMPADQILGKTPVELMASLKAVYGKDCPVPEKICKDGMQHHELIMRTGQEIEVDEDHKDPDGKIRFYHAFKSPVFGFAGEVIGSQGILFDITESKLAQADLAGERDFLRMLLEYCPATIYFKDLQSRFVRASQSAVKNLMRIALSHHHAAHPPGSAEPLPLHLTSVEEFHKFLIGKSDRDIYGPEGSEAFRQMEEEIIRTGQPIAGKVERTVCPDGEEIWKTTTKSPWRDKHGQIIGTFGTSMDITEIKKAEARLDDERALLQFVLDNSPDYIYFKDLQSRFIKTGRKHAEQFGLKRAEEAFGKTDFDFFDKAHAEPAFRDEQEIIRTGKPLIGKAEKKVSKDGKISWALTTKMPLRNKAGEIIGTFGISKDITAMKEAEAKLEEMHRKLLETSRQAGMAEVATGVLHNVGNVLNSVNVASNMLADRLRKSKTPSVRRVAAMMQEHAADLGTFMTEDPKGRQLPSFLAQLAEHLAAEQAAALEELSGLEKNIDHIKDIVVMQQSYAKVSGITQTIQVTELVEDALRMNDRALIRHDVRLIRDYDPAPTEITVDKHKVMQILINLVRNAKYACDEAATQDKRMSVRVSTSAGRVRISIADNGVGIPPENLTRIFNHGFTTRKNGHGFGLHSGALAAKELGGALLVHSDGPGKGATFTLELPLHPPSSTS